MAYNQYYGSPHPGGANPYGGEEYAEEINPRYSADPFSNQQAYSSLPLSEDPEMVDLSGGQRPLSGYGSDAGSSSAYWAPGRQAAAGGAAGAGAYGLGEDWDDGQDSWWRRRRWLVIAAICALIAALAIGLGVGLGVGLNNSKKNDNAARLSDSKSSADRPTGSSVSVGTVLFTSTSFGSGSSASEMVSTSTFSSTAPDPTTSSTTTTPPPSSSATTTS